MKKSNSAAVFANDRDYASLGGASSAGVAQAAQGNDQGGL